MFTNNLVLQVQQDIVDWTVNWVEQPNEFYNNKFPVCPYAQQARLSGHTRIQAYPGGPVRQFVLEQLKLLANTHSHQQLLIVLPPRARFIPGITAWIRDQNSWLIAEDLFVLPGRAVTTRSRYPGWFNSGAYFIVGVNTLSQVLPAVDKLQAAGYYQDWSAQHYTDVVVRRQQLYQQHRQNNDS